MNARRLIHHPQASADPLNELYAIRSGEDPPQNTRRANRTHDPCSVCGRGSGDGRMMGSVGLWAGGVLFGIGLMVLFG